MASVCVHMAAGLLFLTKIVPEKLVVPIGVEWQARLAPAPPTARVRADRVERHGSPQTAAPEQPAAGAVHAGAQDGVAVSELERYKFELRLFLENHKVYPEIAKRLHQTGTVIIQFKVNAEGSIDDVRVASSSPFETLNRAAQDLIRRAARFRPIPGELHLSELTLTLPIEYRL